MAQMATPPHGAHALAMIDALAEIERETHIPGLAALRASGVPMNAGEPEGSGEPEGEPAAGGEPTGGAGEPAGGAGEGEPAGGEPETFDRDYVTKLRRESAGYRKRAQDLEAAEQARQDAELGELERVTKRAEEAESKAARLEREALREKVARKHGLDDDLLEFIVGDTEDEMTAKAAVLAGKVKEAPPVVVPGGPQGGGGSSTAVTVAEARRLASEDPEKFNQLFEAGEIPASALAPQK